MKKMLFTVFLAASMVSAAHALFIAEGTSELGLSGLVDFETASGTLVQGSVFYGYFVQDALQVGGMVEVWHDDDITAWTLGPRVEQNFDIGIELVPFLAASLRFAAIDGLPESDSKNALILGGEAGAKFFLNEYFAISAALKLDLATDDIYPSEKDYDQHDIRIEFGVRTFF
jgi:hypothetical protein